MRHLIEPYEIFPGEHCGSAAMRGLLQHYSGLDLPEPAVFGLGSGLDAVYLSGDAMDPAAVLFGRGLTMEQDLGRHLQIDYREDVESDDDAAWATVREEVLAGRPTMLSGDIFYLDYRDYKVHFPSHRFVLLGFDDDAEEAYIADRVRSEFETCSLGALRKSRNPPEGLSTQNLWGRFHDGAVGAELGDAARAALKQNTEAMLGLDASGSAPASDAPMPGAVRGIAGIEAYAKDLASFCGREDAQWIASFNASCLEKFGNGGGNFRRLFAGFLDWAKTLDPALVPPDGSQLATRSADAWTEASNALYAASQNPTDPTPWNEASRAVQHSAEIERRLFTELAERVG